MKTKAQHSNKKPDSWAGVRGRERDGALAVARPLTQRRDGLDLGLLVPFWAGAPRALAAEAQAGLSFPTVSPAGHVLGSYASPRPEWILVALLRGLRGPPVPRSVRTSVCLCLHRQNGTLITWTFLAKMASSSSSLFFLCQ